MAATPPRIVPYLFVDDVAAYLDFLTVAADKRLLWTNSSYLTVSDTLFKRGPLFAAAATRPPFSRLVIT